LLKLFLMVGILLAGPALSQESGPREPEHKTEAAKHEQKASQSFQHLLPPSTQSSSTFINVYTAKHAGEESECSSPKNWKEWGAFSWCRTLEWIDAERVIAAFTVILGLVTGILGLATWKLWRSTDRLVKGAEDTASRQLRAYVLAKNCKVTRENGKSKLRVKVQNYGQTPAHELKIWLGYRLRTYPPTDEFWSRKQTIKQSVYSLGPDDFTESFTDGSDIDEKIDADLKSGVAVIYGVGSISYVDIFGKTQTGEFRFGFGGPYGIREDGMMTACEAGNRYD
jgi:hypothetical protein